MDWLKDLFLFLFVPGLVIFAILLSHRGPKRRYKIVKETNSLGEEKYEVWFEYRNHYSNRVWHLEKTFDTEDLANEFVARQHTTRETIKEGTL